MRTKIIAIVVMALISFSILIVPVMGGAVSWSNPDYGYGGSAVSWSNPDYGYGGSAVTWDNPDMGYGGSAVDWDNPDMGYGGNAVDWVNPDSGYDEGAVSWENVDYVEDRSVQSDMSLMYVGVPGMVFPGIELAISLWDVRMYAMMKFHFYGGRLIAITDAILQRAERVETIKANMPGEIDGDYVACGATAQFIGNKLESEFGDEIDYNLYRKTGTNMMHVTVMDVTLGLEFETVTPGFTDAWNENTNSNLDYRANLFTRHDEFTAVATYDAYDEIAERFAAGTGGVYTGILTDEIIEAEIASQDDSWLEWAREQYEIVP